MIKGRIKQIDSYSIELKMMFRPRVKRFGNKQRYSLETYFFLPVDMGVNKRNFTNTDFYRELKSYIKIDPAKALLSEIADLSAPFIQQLNAAFDNFDRSAESDNFLSDRIKIFMNILKKSLKRELRKIEVYKSDNEKTRVAKRLITNFDIIISHYRKHLEQIQNSSKGSKVRTTFAFGDEYMSNLKYRYLQDIIFKLNFDDKSLEKSLTDILRQSLQAEKKYRKKRGYPIASHKDKDNNKLIRRWDIVKYFIANKLVLDTRVDKDSKYLVEIFYSIAAGLAMVFATAIAFYYSKKFGNFTMGLFIALVISYMFKDRLKEWGRNFINSVLKKQMLDHRFSLYDSNRKKIGTSNTGFIFIPKRNLIDEISNLRYKEAGLTTEEKVMKYTHKIRINTSKLKSTFKGVDIRGINDVIKFNFLPLTLRLEDPSVPIFAEDAHRNIQKFYTDKTIPVNIIFTIRTHSTVIFQKYLLLINRNGIKKLKLIETITT